MFPIMQIGPFAIRVPSLFIILGLWLGLSFAERKAPSRDVNPTTLYNLILISLVISIIGARLLYVVRFRSIFTSNPRSIISFNPGLLDPLGGVALGLIAALIYAQYVKLKLWHTLDALTPLLAVMGIALGLANLSSGNFFGSPTNLPWAIQLWGTYRHPTQIYEIILATIILAILQAFWRRESAPGIFFLSFIAMSAASRLFLEAFRGDSVLVLNGLRQAQIIAWIILALSLWGIGKSRNQTFT